MAIDTTIVRSRRSLLTATLAAMAGAAAATVAGAQRVMAAGDDGRPIAVAGSYTDARDTTYLANKTNDESVSSFGSNKGGTGVLAYSVTGRGVFAQSVANAGLSAYSDSGVGVHAMSGYFASANDGYPAAVLGEVKMPAGVSILGNNYATKGHAQGVQGTTSSPIGLATTGWASRGGTGLVGVAGSVFPVVPAKTGVYGNAPGGRGGQFAGGKAQLRLVPSAAASHPHSGEAGDLFLDKSHRLWLCKGGTTWVGLA